MTSSKEEMYFMKNKKIIIVAIVIIVAIAIVIDTIIHKIKNKKQKEKNYMQKEQIGYMLGVTNMTIYMFILICINYII